MTLPETAPAKDEALRNRIMNAADDCFSRHGIAKTTMEDVAAAARLSRPTLYRYFGSREDLIGAVFLRAMGNFDAEAKKRIERESSFGERVVAAVSLAVEIGVGDRYVRMALAPETEGLARDVMRTRIEQVEAAKWMPMLRRAVDRGEARADIDVEKLCRWIMDVEFMLFNRIVDGALRITEIPDIVRNLVVPGLIATSPNGQAGA